MNERTKTRRRATDWENRTEGGERLLLLARAVDVARRRKSRRRARPTARSSNGMSWGATGKRSERRGNKRQRLQLEASAVDDDVGMDKPTLPRGFSALEKFRKAADIEVGSPWVAYSAVCERCGARIATVDRRARMEEWLHVHRHHNPDWRHVTCETFDYKVSERTRLLYALYKKLNRSGLLPGGLRSTVENGSAELSEARLKAMKNLLESVDASGFKW